MIDAVTVRGTIDEICYLTASDATGRGFIVDPGAEPDRLLQLIRERGLTPEGILLTHGHFDHIGAVSALRDALEVPVYAHEKAGDYLSNPRLNLSAYMSSPIVLDDFIPVREGEIVALREEPGFSMRILYTPGHTADSVVYYSAEDRAAFVGDLIFRRNIGATHFPGGNLETLLKSIREKIFTLPEDTRLYSGHSEPTTVGEEKSHFPW